MDILRPATKLAAAAVCCAAVATAPARAQTEIKIGATLPLTGAESRIGGFYKEGYDLAFEEWNKKGGLDVGGKKMKLSLQLLDDTSTQATAASLAFFMPILDGLPFPSLVCQSSSEAMTIRAAGHVFFALSTPVFSLPAQRASSA